MHFAQEGLPSPANKLVFTSAPGTWEALSSCEDQRSNKITVVFLWIQNICTSTRENFLAKHLTLLARENPSDCQANPSWNQPAPKPAPNRPTKPKPKPTSFKPKPAPNRPGAPSWEPKPVVPAVPPQRFRRRLDEASDAGKHRRKAPTPTLHLSYVPGCFLRNICFNIISCKISFCINSPAQVLGRRVYMYYISRDPPGRVQNSLGFSETSEKKKKKKNILWRIRSKRFPKIPTYFIGSGSEYWLCSETNGFTKAATSKQDKARWNKTHQTTQNIYQKKQNDKSKTKTLQNVLPLLKRFLEIHPQVFFRPKKTQKHQTKKTHRGSPRARLPADPAKNVPARSESQSLTSFIQKADKEGQQIRLDQHRDLDKDGQKACEKLRPRPTQTRKKADTERKRSGGAAKAYCGQHFFFLRTPW